MQINDFLLYKQLCENVTSLIAALDGLNSTDLDNIKVLKRSIDELNRKSFCSKEIEQEVNRIMRFVQSQFFTTEDYMVKKKGIDAFGLPIEERSYNYVPVVPFVKPKRLKVGELYEQDIKSKFAFLAYVLGSKHIAEDELTQLTFQQVSDRISYQRAVNGQVFDGQKLPKSKRKREKAVKQAVSESAVNVAFTQKKMDTIKTLIASISEGGYLNKAIIKVFNDRNEYVANSIQEIDEMSKKIEENKSAVSEIESQLKVRNIDVLDNVTEGDILERYRQGKVSKPFLKLIVEASLSDKEFEYLLQDRKLRPCLAGTQLKPATTDEELIKEIVISELASMCGVKLRKQQEPLAVAAMAD